MKKIYDLQHELNVGVNSEIKDETVMQKIYDLQYELNAAIHKAAAETLGKEMTLRELLAYGWGSVRTVDDYYLGFDEADFSEEELNTTITVLDEFFEDGDGYPYVKIIGITKRERSDL